jgi:predicted nucleic-acid-binding protein
LPNHSPTLVGPQFGSVATTTIDQVIPTIIGDRQFSVEPADIIVIKHDIGAFAADGLDFHG